MGTSRDQFFKYPRTPHLFGSSGGSDDKHLGEQESESILTDASLIVEEKLDGTNVGLHFDAGGKLCLQCRGHEITEGMHPQYDLFKQWAYTRRPILERSLEDRYLLFGEWMYACHSVFYSGLPHYFFEFDILDKITDRFLDLAMRLDLLRGTGIQTVPVIHRGPITRDRLSSLIGPSRFDSRFENPATGAEDNLMEGLYLRTESGGAVTARAKFVRPEFVERVKLSRHWQSRPLVPNRLRDNAEIWS